MRKLFFLSAGLCYCLAAFAQTDQAVVTVKYTLKHVIDTTQPDNPVTQKYMLYLGNTMTRYADDRTPAGNTGTITNLGTLSTTRIVTGSAQGGLRVMGVSGNWQLANSYYKTLGSNTMAYLTLAGDKLFAVEEPIPAINWNISTDTKNIMGMQCQKASGRFKGRDYEAWFAAELPYSNGPWKLGGLPGLIVEAYDTKKEVVFTMTEFKPVKDTAIAITIPSSVIKTTPKEYKQYRDALMRDMQAGRGAVSDSSVFRGTLSVAAVSGGLSAPAQKPRRFNNPIEKEN